MKLNQVRKDSAIAGFTITVKSASAPTPPRYRVEHQQGISEPNEIELYDKAKIDLEALMDRRRKLSEGIREDVELAELHRLTQKVPALNT